MSETDPTASDSDREEHIDCQVRLFGWMIDLAEQDRKRQEVVQRTNEHFDMLDAILDDLEAGRIKPLPNQT